MLTTTRFRFIVCIIIIVEIFSSGFLRIYGHESPKREFRSVWLSSVFNINFPSSTTATPELQRDDFISILDLQMTNAKLVERAKRIVHD